MAAGWRQVNLRLPEELLERVDEARGLVDRNPWLVRVVELALDGADFSQTGPSAPSFPPSPVESS